MIRVLLVEDQVLLRTALQAVFSLEADVEVVAAIGDGAEVLTTARRTAPDVGRLPAITAVVRWKVAYGL